MSVTITTFIVFATSSIFLTHSPLTELTSATEVLVVTIKSLRSFTTAPKVRSPAASCLAMLDRMASKASPR